MSPILVVAPHPDDETLGCGGTLLKARDAGIEIVWLIMTRIGSDIGATPERIAERDREIEDVAKAYNVSETVQFDFPTTRLDTLPMCDVVEQMSQVVRRVAPTDIYLPFRRDAHSDHAVVFDAGVAVAKWFRYPSVRRVLVYETQSETDFDLSPDSLGFRPNVFVDISATIKEKLQIAGIFKSEFSAHPFPRSMKGIEALATLRGAASGFEAAEAFMLLRERIGDWEERKI